MRYICAAVLILVLLVASPASARTVKEVMYDSVADALTAAGNAPILSTLLAAVTVSG
jgi:hypothetical protein